MYSRFITTCLAVAAATSPLTASAAANSGDAPSRIVSYGDLNLDSHEGVSQLYTRIKSAAREVCEPVVDVSVTDAHLRRRKCEEHAIEQAIEDVRSSKLTTLHMSLTNQIAPTLLR